MSKIENTSDLKPSREGFVTNYPPFRYWKRQSVGSMLSDVPLNIYIHVPYCVQKCAYCYYKTISLKDTRASEIDDYANALCREIELAAKYFHLHERHIDSIYLGGGTPTVLKNENLSQIVKCLHDNLSINEPEFTIETEPVTLTTKKADILKQLGVNRISLGIQSFCDDIIKLANRKDSEKRALQAIKLAKTTSPVVNIDLLSGLAGETQKTWAYSIKRAIEVDVESITVYRMELYANTNYYSKIRKSKLTLPSESAELEFMRYAMEQFEQAHYKPWCFFTFTKFGRYPHTHSPSIWSGNDCYGIGTSAFGSLGDRLLQNTNDYKKYITALDRGELPINRGYRLTYLDRMIRDVLLGMKLLSIDLRKFHEKYGYTLESLCASTIDQLVSEDFISVTANKLELTGKGILYGDYAGKRLAQGLEKTREG
jgi:oxygen-independent coproporphyrinogen-3 oxidase